MSVIIPDIGSTSTSKSVSFSVLTKLSMCRSPSRDDRMLSVPAPEDSINSSAHYQELFTLLLLCGSLKRKYRFLPETWNRKWNSPWWLRWPEGICGTARPTSGVYFLYEMWSCVVPETRDLATSCVWLCNYACVCMYPRVPLNGAHVCEYVFGYVMYVYVWCTYMRMCSRVMDK